MNRLSAVVLTGMLIAATPGVAAAAPSDAGSHIEVTKVAAGDGVIDSDVVPGAARSDAKVNVIVQMKADPVSVVDAKSGGKLTGKQKKALRDSLKQSQGDVVRSVRNSGGIVVSQMQSAYNGVHVKVKGSQLGSIAKLPGVAAIHGAPRYDIAPTNTTSVPFLGADKVWESTGYTGKHVKVAVLDTGIDYTHADFGGPGTVDAFKAAAATSSQPADPALFGPNAPKVKGGTDLVGDAYNAAKADSKPQPDPNPLDCAAAGHGSHVAGSIAGFGVNADGSTYKGPYDTSTPKHEFKVGPGVAPQADLYAVRVFGCEGSTDVTTEAIDWAVANGMDVVNMSLGSPYGTTDSPDAVAARNAVANGVIMVVAAGNNGHNPYLVGSPSTGAGVISVAAVDSTASFPGARITLADGRTIDAINANGAKLGGPYTVVVLKDDPSTPENEALGCSKDAYVRNGITAGSNQLAVTVRGNCARVARAVYGQQAGAAAVAMVNTSDGLPPFEGPITSNPDTGEAYDVTIPFLGVKGVLGSGSDGDTLVAANGQQVSLSDFTLANPTFRKPADFTSAGPASGDSAAHPSVAAPGVSIKSVAVGSGSDYETMSGTSMATPHVAGVAALGVEAHPTWTHQQVGQAVVATADRAGVKGSTVTLTGAGLVDPMALVKATSTAYGDVVRTDGGSVADSSLSFGYAEFSGRYSANRTITLTNLGTSSRTWSLTSVASAESDRADVTVSPSRVTVPAGSSRTVTVTVSTDATKVGTSSDKDDQFSFHAIDGQVVATSGAETLTVPYVLVPRVDAQVGVQGNPKLDGKKASVSLMKKTSGVATSADVYTLGVTDPKDGDETATDKGWDVKATGVASFGDAQNPTLAFAVNTWSRHSNAGIHEFDVALDTNNDGKADKVIFSYDSGQIRNGDADGLSEVFIYDPATKALKPSGYLSIAPTDSSTVVLPIDAASVGITGQFQYAVSTYSGYDSAKGDETDAASYNPFKKVFNDGQSVSFGANQKKASFPVTFDAAAYRADPDAGKGLLVIATDNATGTEGIVIPKRK